MTSRQLWFVLLVALAGLTAGCSTDDPNNEPPTITLNVGSEQTYVVGEDVIRIQVSAQDPDGDSISFEVVDRPERAQFQTFSNSALFTWDPIPSDVTGQEPLRLIFAATDSQGARAEQTVHIHIRAGNGLPRFLTPSSMLYDPSSNQPLTIDVEVRDDDSNQVILTMPGDSAPAGASFDQVGPKEAEFVWNPSVDQRAKRAHSVTFVADDDENDPVSHKVSIIIQQQGGGGGGGGNNDPDPSQSCDDEPILHTPLGAQRTIDDYDVEANFAAAAASRYDIAYLFWTTEDAMNEEVSFESSEMKIDGDRLRAAIPNLLLDAGQSQTVYYAICALDEDAADDDETGFVCAPSGYYYSFRAYSPDETSCLDDTPTGDGFAGATTIPDDRWGIYHTCSGGSDYHTVTVAAGETVDVYTLYSYGQDLDITLYDDAEKQRDPTLFESDCYGLALIELEGPDSGEQTWFVEIAGDDTPYQLSAFRYGEATPECSDAHLEPNDTASDATLVFDEVALFEDMEICEADDVDVYAFDMLVGDVVDIFAFFTHADGDLDMTLFAPSEVTDVSRNGYGSAQGWSTDDDEDISHTAQESGIYHLAVFSADQPNSYDLGLDKACADDDAFGSDNRDSDSAEWIEADTHDNLKACADTADWYERYQLTDEFVIVELTVVQGARLSDVSLDVHDDNGWVGSATETGGRLELAFEAPEAGTYYYRVSSTSDMVYSLTLLE